MTDAFTIFRLINIVSGFVFIALGAIAALRPNSKTHAALALFLMAWGAQIALTNLAATQSKPLALALYLFGEGFLPLQAMFLLLFAAESAIQDAGESTRRVVVSGLARIGAIVALAIDAVGLVVAMWPHSTLLTVTAGPDGLMGVNLGTQSLWFFDAPQFLGVSVAFCILGWTIAKSRQAWQIVGGVGAAWAAAISYPAVAEYEDAHFSPLFIVLLVSGVLVFVGVLGMFRMASRSWMPARASSLAFGVLLIGVLAGLASHFNNTIDVLYAIAPPGAFRLIAALVLAPAVWMTGLPWVSRRGLPLAVILLGALMEAVLFTLSIFSDKSLPPFLQRFVTWAALVTLSVIFLFGLEPALQGLRGAEQA